MFSIYAPFSHNEIKKIKACITCIHFYTCNNNDTTSKCEKFSHYYYNDKLLPKHNIHVYNRAADILKIDICDDAELVKLVTNDMYQFGTVTKHPNDSNITSLTCIISKLFDTNDVKKYILSKYD